jgi:DNA-binding response OmpR family regulator
MPHDSQYPMSDSPHLIALESAAQPGEFSLDDAGCSLGRAAACHVIIPRPVVSRRHALIERAGARFQLRDLGSVNGTYVNGQRLREPHLLVNYDLIGLGEACAQLTFVDPDSTYAATPRLRYDERTMRFFVGGRAVDLTPNQFRLLRQLYVQGGQVSSREQCAVAVWGADYAPGMEATTLDRLVSTLRAAIRQVDPDAAVVDTRPGLGYQLAEAA